MSSRSVAPLIFVGTCIMYMNTFGTLYDLDCYNGVLINHTISKHVVMINMIVVLLGPIS